jgi:hypothetical protein
VTNQLRIDRDYRQVLLNQTTGQYTPMALVIPAFELRNNAPWPNTLDELKLMFAKKDAIQIRMVIGTRHLDAMVVV